MKYRGKYFKTTSDFTVKFLLRKQDHRGLCFTEGKGEDFMAIITTENLTKVW